MTTAKGRARALDPRKVVASFDSASVLHAALVAALNGRPFPHLGSSPVAAAGVRAAARLPWPLLRGIYARIGAAEGIDPNDLDRVDMAAVAASFADAYPVRPYPAAIVGSTNGALTHLAAAMQIPWLPATVLVPVARVADADRPDLALDFGRRVAPRLLDGNPDVVLHQMHDAAQDELMVARMTYFRTKWATLPDAYARFLGARLSPGAPVIIADDRSQWPVVRVGSRHVFQNGGRGGLTPEQYQQRGHGPSPDDHAPEAEWGCEPGLVAAVRQWCAANKHPCVLLAFDGPQAAAHPVAVTVRGWYAAHGRRTDRLIVPSFVLGDPWRTLQLAAVPYWAYFGVEEALQGFDAHLAEQPAYREILLLIFQHGAASPGYAGPDEWRAVARRHGARLRTIALREDESPHDIGLLGRYGPAMRRMKNDPTPWSPLPPADALAGLAAAGGVHVLDS